MPVQNAHSMKLTEVRIGKGMSKADLARKAQMQQTVIGWIESGRFVPYDSQLAKIAAALGWDGDIHDLLEEVG